MPRSCKLCPPKIQHIPREQSWIQRYALNRMLFRSVNPNSSKSGGCGSFYQKTPEVLAQTGTFENPEKNGLQAIFLLFELASPLTEVFWVLLIYWMLNAGIFIVLYSTKSMCVI